MSVLVQGKEQIPSAGSQGERYVKAPQIRPTRPVPTGTSKHPCHADRWAYLLTHRARLVAIARNRVESHEDAEDLAHDALLRAVTAGIDLDDPRLAAWLTTVTKNLCTDHLRRRGRARRAVALLGESATPGPEEDVTERAEAAWICERINKLLPVRQRTALELRARGFSVPAVADALGVSYKAAEALLAHARTSVRRTIRESRQEKSR